MRYVSKLRFPVLALTAVLGLVGAGNVSAQSVAGGAQGCSSASFAGVQLTCQVSTPSQLGLGQALLIAPTSPAGAAPLQCSGVNGPGYATQAAVSAFSPVAGGVAAGYPGCEFQVTAGIVPAGAPVGSELIDFSSSAAGGLLQQTVALCGDPSCGSVSASVLVSPPPQPPLPPTLVTLLNTQFCTSQPGWLCSAGWSQNIPQNNVVHDGNNQSDNPHGVDHSRGEGNRQGNDPHGDDQPRDTGNGNRGDGR